MLPVDRGNFRGPNFVIGSQRRLTRCLTTRPRCSQDDVQFSLAAARQLVSPVITRGSCRVYRIKQQTNQVATMGLTSRAAVAASDTDVEFSSRLLQTVLAWRNIRGSGVGHVPPSCAWKLVGFSLTITVTLSLVATTKKRGATIAKDDLTAGVANGGIDSPFVSLSSDVTLSPRPSVLRFATLFTRNLRRD